MKHIYKALIFSLVLSLPSFCSAKITFDLDFADAPGTGFHAKPEAKQAFYDALNQAADWFDDSYDAVLRFQVISDEDSSSNTGASFQPFKRICDELMDSLPGLNQLRAQRAILDSEIIEGYHGYFNVNLSHAWSFMDEVKSYRIDFKAAIIHEFLHALGFMSSIDCDDDEDDEDITTVDSCVQYLGQKLDESDTGITPDDIQGYCEKAIPLIELYHPDAELLLSYDAFIHDENNTKLIDINTMTWPKQTYCGTEGQNTNRFYFEGPNAGRLPLSSQSPLDPNSFSHIIDDYPFDDCIMNPSSGHGLEWREPCTAEVGVLKDLGYKLKIDGRKNIPVYCQFPEILDHGEKLTVVLTEGYDHTSKVMPIRLDHGTAKILGSANPSSWIDLKINGFHKVSLPLASVGCSIYEVQTSKGNDYTLSVENIFNKEKNAYFIQVNATPSDSIDESSSKSTSNLFDTSNPLPLPACTQVDTLPKAAYFTNESALEIEFTAVLTNPAAEGNLDEIRVSVHQTPEAYLGFINDNSEVILYADNEEFFRVATSELSGEKSFTLSKEESAYQFKVKYFMEPTHRYFRVILRGNSLLSLFF